ncbi:MAG: histidine triad nucleotide-binding protein [Christensenellaceae bacterium]|nr:histidine triad nucleotide-binding protein [Christensenellaceae bacterium]
MDNCIFCKIIAGEIPSTKVYEDEKTYAFYDLNPQAKQHVLVVGKRHHNNIVEACEDSIDTVSACINTCTIVAKQLGIDKTGFRIVTNCGKDACQSVFHLHFHVIGGEKLSERMA